MQKIYYNIVCSRSNATVSNVCKLMCQNHSFGLDFSKYSKGNPKVCIEMFLWEKQFNFTENNARGN